MRLLPCGTCPRRSRGHPPAPGRRNRETGRPAGLWIRWSPGHWQPPSVRCSGTGFWLAWGSTHCTAGIRGPSSVRRSGWFCRRGQSRGRRFSRQVGGPAGRRGPWHWLPVSNIRRLHGKCAVRAGSRDRSKNLPVPRARSHPQRAAWGLDPSEGYSAGLPPGAAPENPENPRIHHPAGASSALKMLQAA